MKYCWLYISLVACTMAGCQPLPLLCVLNFTDFEKTYHFDIPVPELKNRIVEAYSYDESLLAMNFGHTAIENEAVNRQYRQSVDVWLDKRNWDDFKADIRQHTGDTLNLIIGKFHSNKGISLQVIVRGNGEKSSLTVHGFTYRQRKACKKDREHYLKIVPGQIEKKFISLLQ